MEGTGLLKVRCRTYLNSQIFVHPALKQLIIWKVEFMELVCDSAVCYEELPCLCSNCPLCFPGCLLALSQTLHPAAVLQTIHDFQLDMWTTFKQGNPRMKDDWGGSIYFWNLRQIQTGVVLVFQTKAQHQINQRYQ